MLFERSVASLHNKVIKDRLKAISTLNFHSSKIALPVGFIRALGDKLVPPSKCFEFGSYFGNIVMKEIEGPHFLLQAKPKESAAVITALAKALISC